MATAFLKVVSGSRAGLNIPLSADAPLLIGRKRGDLLIDDAMVSSAHAQLVPRDDGWAIQDLGSTNGTMVDGRLVRDEVLKPGAEITIGGTKLVLFVGLGDGSQAEGPPPAKAEIAWLLDEELVEVPPDAARGTDVIDLNLRLPPGCNALVEATSGADQGKAWRFTRGSATIGRRTGEVPLSDLEVSRRHAVIEIFGRDMMFVRDLESTNGTYHNGRRVAAARLKSGDTIGIGKTVLKLVVNR